MTLLEYRKYLNRFLKDYAELVHLTPHLSERKYFCINPLHNDVVPSMVYYSGSEPHFYCHGCNSYFDIVDVYKYVYKKMKLKDELNLKEALKEIAEQLQKAGYNIKPFYDDKKLYAAAQDIYKYITKFPIKGAQKDFLENKGIDPEKARAEGVGMIHNFKNWQRFLYNLKNRYGEDLITDAKFDNKLVFNTDTVIYTYFDQNHQPVAFAARRLEGEPKYINTGTTSIFQKKKTGYGIHKVLGQKSVYLVEGYNDALAFWTRGFYNIMAVGSASISLELLTLLKKHGTERIVITLDPDEAGMRGALDAILKHIPKAKLYATVKILPDNKDPDEILRDEGINGFYKYKNIPAAAFILQMTGSLHKTMEYLVNAPVKDLNATLEIVSQVAIQRNIDLNPEKLKVKLMKRYLKQEIDKLKNTIGEAQSKIEHISNFLERLL